MWRLDAKRALVATVDFFAPVVDDPRDFGAIAAANALSDVWAMGGRPLYALSVVGWPRDKAPFEQLAEVLAGGAELAHAAGCPIVGGHSVDDTEPKYGLAVTGLVHPGRILSNAGARPGDVLLLTKALGIGVATTALKKGVASPETAAAAVAQMKTLNRAAGELLARRWKQVHALTDITGFGLLGHLDSMLRASGVGARIDASAVPLLPGVRALAEAGVMPGGSKANLAFVAERVAFPDAMGEVERLLLADAQTNGGLLAAVAPRAATRMLRELGEAGAPAVRLGEVLEARADGVLLEVRGKLGGGETPQPR